MQAVTDLNLTDDEAKFVLHLEWDALRAAIAQYQGRQEEGIDFERCQITSIAHTDQGIEIAEIVLPPKEMPKILPCSLGDKQQSQQQQQYFLKIKFHHVRGPWQPCRCGPFR